MVKLMVALYAPNLKVTGYLPHGTATEATAEPLMVPLASTRPDGSASVYA